MCLGDGHGPHVDAVAHIQCLLPVRNNQIIILARKPVLTVSQDNHDACGRQRIKSSGIELEPKREDSL